MRGRANLRRSTLWQAVGANPNLNEAWQHDLGEDAARRPAPTRDMLMSFLFQLADVMLRVEFKAEPANKIELRLEKVDVALFVCHQLFE